MRYSKFKVLLLLTVILIFGNFTVFALHFPSGKTVIVLGTFDYPPLMIKESQVRNGKENIEFNQRQGIGVDFLKQAFSKHNEYELKVKFYPSKRAMHEFSIGEVDIFLGSRMDLPDILNDIIPIKLLPLKSVLFCLPENCAIANNQKKDAKFGTISSIPGSPVNEILSKNGNQVYTQEKLDRTFKFLLAKRADYVAAIDFSGHYMLQTMNFPDLDKVEQVDFDLLEIPYDAVIRKDNKYAAIISKIIHDELQNTDFKLMPKEIVEQYLKLLNEPR